ncbi:MAG TPA: MATE family efflux transporter [Pseudogracilibacillus sp.]|nr:MATE family efflux transporter [Pseudogracilibacillus sp.]
MSSTERLATQSVRKSFFQYLFPSLIGMALLSVNIVIDGIFVGHGVGTVALAGVNIASPVFSVLLSLSLLIGVGGGTLYSISLGKGNVQKGRSIFTLSFFVLTIITVCLSLICYVFIEPIARFFGANDETIPYVLEYIRILFMFSLIMVWETALSVFVRNDGNPNLAMISLVITSIVNIVLNYWMIFVLGYGVTGAAIATIISMFIGLAILSTHYLRRATTLKFVRLHILWAEIKEIHVIGFPSFLSEVGIGVFVIGYNIVASYYLGTVGLAAFSVINYLHTFMFLLFIGTGTAIQPLVSFYYGAQLCSHIRKLLKLAERTALFLGISCFVVGYIAAHYLVSLFGVTSEEVVNLTVLGIRLFFISYLFMGINFIYTIYYQSIGNAQPALWITVFRSFIVFLAMLFLLPLLFGHVAIWLVLPVTELIICLVLLFTVRKRLFEPSSFETVGIRGEIGE